MNAIVTLILAAAPSSIVTSKHLLEYKQQQHMYSKHRVHQYAQLIKDRIRHYTTNTLLRHASSVRTYAVHSITVFYKR
jgi:hypothetical protein